MRAVIHIGFYKTASTALQERFFPALEGCAPLLRSGPHRHPEFDVLGRNLLHAPDREYLEGTTKALLAEVAGSCGDDGTLLLSDERLSGELFGGFYNRERTARRLHRLLPHASILLCVRSQPPLLRSVYNEYVHRGGGYAPFRDFVTGEAEGCRFSLDDLRFDLLVETYQDLFGRDRVRVLPYELLLAEPAKFLGEVAGLVAPGSPVPALSLGTSNASLSRPGRFLLRGMNRAIRKSAFNTRPRVASFIEDDRLLRATPLARGLRRGLRRLDHPRLLGAFGAGLGPRDQAFAEEVIGFYEEPNRRLERLAGVDLGRWGYPLPGRTASDGARSEVRAEPASPGQVEQLP